MRRSACFLTIVGLSFQSVAAQDVFGPSAEKPKASGTSLQYFGGTSAEASTPSNRLQLAPANSVPIPNYYNELFGTAEQPAPTTTRTQLKPAANTLQTAPATSGIIQADFQADPTGEQGKIQQVRADSFSARPFPGANAPTIPQPKAPAAEAPTAAKPPVPGEESSEVAVPTPERQGTVSFVRGSQATTPPTPPTSAPTVVTNAEVVAGPQTPSVTIEWTQKSAINVGQECQCNLVVKNSGQAVATGVEVEAVFPENVRLLDATPRPEMSETFLGWQFAELKPGEEKTIQIKMIPLVRGNIATRANVRFTGTANSVFKVAEPLLAVNVKGPGEVMIGESAPHTIVVNNPGDGIASNVQIEAWIPDGLEHARGKRLLMEIGSLNPGETRNIRLPMVAIAGGQHRIQVQARADAGLNQTSVADVAIIAPSLLAKVDGPGLRYIGRQGKFTLSVANDGAAATSNVQLMHKIPEGFEFVSANRGVQYDSATRLLTWFVGRLDKGEKSEIEVTLNASKMGEFKHYVRATSEHGSLSDAEFACRVEGTSSLSVEVVDLDDPVELGTEAIYEVRVKNEGSAAAKDVGLACDLSSGVRYLTAQGPAEHISEEGTVVFRTIAELAPGKTAVYRVHVEAAAAGSARFRARVTSESVAEPLTADELTKFYGE